MKWDKLSGNSSLAFYQKRPWLCPINFIPQSLEKHTFCARRLIFPFALRFFLLFEDVWSSNPTEGGKIFFFFVRVFGYAKWRTTSHPFSWTGFEKTFMVKSHDSQHF